MNPRKLLVLDLDETLVHASEIPLGRAGDFFFEEYHVYRRPHLDPFLEFAFSTFDVGVWTSAGEQYAQCVVSHIFQGHAPLFVFSSRRCTLRRDFVTGGYTPVKRLTKLKPRGYRLEHIIAVDDTAEKHQDNYGNLVLVSEYTGDWADEELVILRAYLEGLSTAPNVRTVEKRGWRTRTLPAHPSHARLHK